MARLGGLYVIVDPEACGGRESVSVARAALEGGASMLQWRDKTRDKGLQLPDLMPIAGACIEHDAYLIVNDHVDLALVLAARVGPRAAGFVGVHVGQKDIPVADVRAIVPTSWVVGASTNNVDEARRAARDGASYIAVGDLFGTRSKEGTRAASPGRLAEVKRAVQAPVIGIGGITLENVAEVIAAGADGVAVISAVCGAANPRAAASALVDAIAEARRRHSS